MDNEKKLVALMGLFLLAFGMVALFQEGSITGKALSDLNSGTINVNYNNNS